MKVMKAGEYYIGDPCYVLCEEYLEGFDWVNDYCEPSFEDGENIVVNGLNCLCYDTAHGDGVYPSSVGFQFPVDAGIIGCTPKELWKGEGKPFGSLLVKFENDFTCEQLVGGVLRFGYVEVYTDPDEDDYYK